MDELDWINNEIRKLRSRRAVLLAAVAAERVRRTFPEAALVLFEGPRDSDDTAAILRLIASNGDVVFDWSTNADPSTAQYDALSDLQGYLDTALRDDASVFALGLGGNYVLPVPRA